MFDFGWSELLLIAVVALIVVGPKELPVLLRTLGRYVAKIRSHATQFRTQIDDAIKETEIQSLRDEMTELRDDLTSTMRETTTALDREVDDAKSAMNTATHGTLTGNDPGPASKPQAAKQTSEPKSQSSTTGEKARTSSSDGGKV